MINQFSTVLNIELELLLKIALIVLSAAFLILAIITPVIFFRHKKKKFKIPAKMFRNGFCVIVGGGQDAQNIENKLYEKKVAAIVLDASKNVLRKGSLLYTSYQLSDEFLRKIRFNTYAKNIMFFCAYDDDSENFKAALFLKKNIEEKNAKENEKRPRAGEQTSPDEGVPMGIGRRVVKVLYKNSGKSALYRFSSPDFKFYSLNELTARHFIENYPLAKFLPPEVLEKIEKIEKEPETQIRGSVEPEKTLALTQNSEQKAVAPMEAGNKKESKKEIKKVSLNTLSFLNKQISEEKISEEASITRIFVGFSDTSAEILEKIILEEKIAGSVLNVVVFDKNADTLLPAFYNKANDLLDIDAVIKTPANKNSKMIALKISPESFELYEKIARLVNSDDYCAVYIDTGYDLTDIETAVELRELFIKDKLCGKVSVFVKNYGQNLSESAFILNEGFDENEKFLFYGAFNDIFKYLTD